MIVLLAAGLWVLWRRKRRARRRQARGEEARGEEPDDGRPEVR